MSTRKPSPDDSPSVAPAERPPYLEPTIDAAAMKAFAHPLRMAMYDYLTDRGPATATMLARHTGESTGQTSYHLRQLERHGFVKDDPTRGSGRERWWTSVGFSMFGTELAQDATTRPAVEAMLRNQVARQAAALTAWFQRSEAEDPAWVKSSINNKSTMLLTLQEVAELHEALMTTLHAYVERSRERQGADEDAGGDEDAPGDGDEETRRVRVHLDLFPLPHDD
ncbi:winged helix-turn-helix domain-containing protein [Ornithinimicrobium cavernae]|uniref:winged helix-turn-helix domain-containing protein n=1 Tax=Ornithinimicrobium cavernae TaxID=2666047 RepID=UPI000D691D54|nr:helix-turn-helix domain-containing protein [Ornithinimicrobium cavernae]